MNGIAIIGAGLAGLIVAHELSRQASVTIFEKSRGPGGRMATRYASPYEFDHGTQFFTAKSPEFANFVQSLVAAGVLARWDARFVELDRARVSSRRVWDARHPHFVASPSMNALGKHLAAGLDVRLNTRVAALARAGDGWALADDQGTALGTFERVIVTAPAAQTAELMPESFAAREALDNRIMMPCYALMLGFAERPQIGWQAARVRNADVSWISVNDSKPGRPDACSILVHATNAWSEVHIEDQLSSVTAHLLAELTAVLEFDVADAAAHVDLHRWRYANIDRQHGETSLADHDQGLYACGDWCVRGRVEAAFTSAMDLARRLRSRL